MVFLFLLFFFITASAQGMETGGPTAVGPLSTDLWSEVMLQTAALPLSEACETFNSLAHVNRQFYQIINDEQNTKKYLNMMFQCALNRREPITPACCISNILAIKSVRCELLNNSALANTIADVIVQNQNVISIQDYTNWLAFFVKTGEAEPLRKIISVSPRFEPTNYDKQYCLYSQKDHSKMLLLLWDPSIEPNNSALQFCIAIAIQKHNIQNCSELEEIMYDKLMAALQHRKTLTIIGKLIKKREQFSDSTLENVVGYAINNLSKTRSPDGLKTYSDGLEAILKTEQKQSFFEKYGTYAFGFATVLGGTVLLSKLFARR